MDDTTVIHFWTSDYDGRFLSMIHTCSTGWCGTGVNGGIPLMVAEEGQSTDMVEESDDVVEVDARGRRGVRGGDATARSRSE